MKRIKELNVNIYEVRDLKEDALDNAINIFIEEAITLLGTGEIYNLSRKRLIDTIEELDYYFDAEGNNLPLFNNNSENLSIYKYSLTDYLVVNVTLEDI